MTGYAKPDRGVITPMVDIAFEVERCNQHKRWGQQDHPDFAGLLDRAVQRAAYAERAEWWKSENALRVRIGQLAWDGILLEEVFEALGETDPAALRAELVQVAAVAAAWVEAIDRRPPP